MAVAAPEVDVIEYPPGEPPKSPIDPITARVIAGALDSIVLEVGHKLTRMSYSSIIRESEDFGVALLDVQGRQICECALSTPLQLGPIPGYMQGIFQLFKERGDVFEEGDVIIHNSPYHGASHGPDVGFCVPVFFDNELVGFSFTTAHHLDIGSMSPGSCGIVDAVDTLTVDLTGTAPQVSDRAINMPFIGTTDIAIYVTLRSILLDQWTHEYVPQNSGLVRPIRIIAERGSLPNPTFPCETIARFCAGNIVADTLMRALSPICPDRVAAGMGNMKVIAYSGVVSGNYWVYMDITEGAYGGRVGKDRVDSVDGLY